LTKERHVWNTQGMDDTVQVNSPQEPSKQLQQKQAPKTTKKLNWKGFGICIIIVVIIEIFAVNALKNDNNQSATANQAIDMTNWKTYSTDVATLKYPNTWIIYTDSAYIYDPKSLTKVRMNGGGTQLLPREYLSMISYSSTETAKQVVDESMKGNPAYSGVNTERKTITINGFQAEMYAESGEGSQGYDIVISNGKDLAFLTIPVSDPSSDPVINKILSTFKFTN